MRVYLSAIVIAVNSKVVLMKLTCSKLNATCCVIVSMQGACMWSIEILPMDSDWVKQGVHKSAGVIYHQKFGCNSHIL
jgi:hypothetical protein